MPLLNVRRNSQGFTLTEAIFIAIVTSTLLAIAIPGFVGWFRRKQLDDALVSLHGALQEAQTQAIRKGTTCEVLVPDGNNKTLTQRSTSAAGCLLSNRVLPNGVGIISNLQTNPKRISFSFRGNTTNSATVVLYRFDNSLPDHHKCLAISNGLGIMRTGRYSGSTASASNITADNCTTPQ